MFRKEFHLLTRICLFLLVFLVFSSSEIIVGFGLDQEPGVIVISNPKSPRPTDGKRKRIIFKEELTIGVAEGDENYMFGDMITFNTDDEGNFYITDWDRRRIQKYDPSGKYLLTIGKQGQGPGEFQALSAPRFDSRNRLYITDANNRRINFFDKSGNYLEQISLPDVFENLYINSRGYYVSIHTREIESQSYKGYRIEWGIFDSQFNLVSELFSMIQDFKPPAGRDPTSIANFSASILSTTAFRPLPVFVVADNDLIYIGVPEKYVIDMYSPEGKKIKSMRREYDPIKITRKDKEYFEKGVGQIFLKQLPGQLRKETLRFIEYPKYKPAYSSFALMENGWLAVVVEFIENEYTLFDLFDRDGNYIGHFKADVTSDFLFFKNGKAYAVATKDDYKFAKRYAIEIVDEGQR